MIKMPNELSEANWEFLNVRVGKESLSFPASSFILMDWCFILKLELVGYKV